MSERAQRTRAALAQNLFAAAAPARVLVRAVDIQPGERVYDLGAGAGLITRELLRAGARVVAVERDANLARKLRARFAGEAVQVVEADLTRVAFAQPFKVVANPPFNLTAALLRRLLFDAPAPEAAALVLQREAADKYAGRRANALALMAAPWFEISVAGRFERRDFVPAPRVDVALLRIVRRPEPQLEDALAEPWRAFVAHAFARPRPDARHAFRNLVSNLQWRRLSADLGVAPDALRGDLSYPQWLGVFRFVLTSTPVRKQERFSRI